MTAHLIEIQPTSHWCSYKSEESGQMSCTLEEIDHHDRKYGVSHGTGKSFI